MHRYHPVAIAAPALIALLAITGCAESTPAGTAPPSPSVDTTATTPAATDTDAAPSAGSESPTTDDWARYAVGDEHTSWSMPADWFADIEREVVEGNEDRTDYRGLIRDDAGTPMLRFEAIASGGQYATDFAPCERPRTEVFESVPLGEQVLDRGSTASVTTLAYATEGGVVFAAGVSDNDPEAACEPGILALYQAEVPAGYDFLVLEIVDDSGESAPVFPSFEAARAYLDTDEYANIRGVLTSFHSS